MTSAYLLINLLSVAVPLACSFERRLRFYRSWPALAVAILLPGIPFLLWDALFTHLGVWGFSERYLLGIYAFNLPLEEVLFFLCIPYCCVFSHAVLGYFVRQDAMARAAPGLTWLAIVVLVALAAWNHGRLYTFWACSLAAVFLLVHALVLRRGYWPRLLLTYAVMLLPFLLVNGLLTGTMLEGPIVWYDDRENLGIRLLTIPVEDTVYGFLLIGLNITVFEEMRPRRASRPE